uniref:Protein amnionless n=1 Tax=Myripristis murdjan TaxID=586833 RepID=A0A668AU34_9TELE
MLKSPDVFLLFCLVGVTNAMYKQWIPDTNYENKTNWDKGVVPCGNDRVWFSAQVSVFVEKTHSVQELKLPIDGEFILNSGAGFYVGGEQEVGCGGGITNQFKDSESRWFNPALWQAGVTQDDLQKGQFVFSVHEESVPCQYDDVVFKANSSFRVDTTSSSPSIPVQTVSILGKTFSSGSEFSQYLSSPSGRLQFHGSPPVSVGNSGCGDPSGCDCGNSANHDQICDSVTCPSLTCEKPLRPVGHCCDVCGAIVTIHYANGFNLQVYRERLQLFLLQPPYKSVQLGMSKVFKSQRIMGVVPFGASAEIQVVVLDGERGPQSGLVAEALAHDILKDIHSQGSDYGIAGAEFQASSGSSSDEVPENITGMVVGGVFGVLLLVNADVGDLGGPLDHGFDNPMFDHQTKLPAALGLYGTEINDTIYMTQSGVHFVNPVYDENETDFNA